MTRIIKLALIFLTIFLFIGLFVIGTLIFPSISAQTQVPCYYIYNAWSDCSTTGIQTRTYTVSPEGCYQLEPPVTQQTCSTYTQTTSCLYTYSEWSVCESSGRQTRTIISKSPLGCDDSAIPILEQTCNYTSSSTVPCYYIYNAWTDCSTTDIQTRTYTVTPEGCYQLEPPVTQQTCTHTQPTPCTYTYSEWSVCEPSGRQTRTIISKSPVGCYETEPPVLIKTCFYSAPTPSPANNENKTESIPCTYYYSAWSGCVSGRQTRIIISKSPLECHEASTPILDQSCNSVPSGSETAPSADVPAPAPDSMLSLENISQLNFNDRTSNSWQYYYFGSDNCLDPNTCGGMADLDNDGLNNNEEYRFGTDPKNPDSDHDGYIDADEIQNGRNPLITASDEKSDKMVFESPKEKGEVKRELYKVDNVEAVKITDEGMDLKISGKALPDIYVTIYIYSDPIILTIKTDSDGNWSYVLNKPLEDGEHQVYVAVTDNTGKVMAKSEPITFVQTAQAAVQIIPSAEAAAAKGEGSPTKTWFKGSYFIFIVIGLVGLVLALVAIGLARSSSKKTKNDINN